MRHFLPALLVFDIFSAGLHAADFAEELAAVKAKHVDAETQKFLADGYEANKTNPEYFVLAANYWWNVSKQISITTKPAAGSDFSVRDQKTGKEVGSISTSGAVNPQLAQKAVDLLAEAATKFPARADIQMGLAYLQHEMGKEENCSTTLNGLLDRCADTGLELTWKGGAMPAPAREFIPRSMQKYAGDFYREETKEGDARCRKLCEHLIQVYPEHPFAYNNLAALSHAHKDETACLNYLKLANEKAPEDMLVLMNLGDAYLRAGNKIKAKACYESAAKDKDPELRAQASKALKSLRDPVVKKK